MALNPLPPGANLEAIALKVNEIIAHINAAQKIQEGLVRKGKYAGKQTDWVVENDPWYIQWMCRENLNTEAFGFTELQVQEAIDDQRPDPRRR